MLSGHEISPFPEVFRIEKSKLLNFFPNIDMLLIYFNSELEGNVILSEKS